MSGTVDSLDEMAVFVSVVSAGSFTAAAKALSMPNSTVSRRVANLEARLGVRLLERTTRSMRLTEVGEEFYARATAVVRDARDAEAAARERDSVPRGLLRISAPALFSQAKLLPAVVEYLRRFPECEVDLVPTARRVDLVSEGFDLAFRGGDLDDSSLVARKLDLGPAVICASPAYLSNRGTPERPSDLASHDCICWGSHSGPTWQFQRARPVDVRGRLTVGTPELAHAAALRGAGIARLPGFLIQPDVAEGRLVPLLQRWAGSTVFLHALFPSKRHLSPKIRAFLDIVEAQLANDA